MLNRNKEIRYCNFEQISGHVWFKDFNWDSLISLDMVPEYMSEYSEKEEDFANEKKPYKEYVKNSPDWEMPEHKIKITEQYKNEFDEWIKKF